MAVEIRVRRVLNRLVPVDKLAEDDMMQLDAEEIWKPCQECRDYEVSSLGRVRSLARTVPVGANMRSLPTRLLKPTILNNGYAQVCLGTKKHSVHRLVAAAFVEGDRTKVVNHKNGVRDDNRASNLEWASVSENASHAYRDLGRKPPALGKFGFDHPSTKPLTLNGVTKTATEWAAERGWSVTVIRSRLSAGWSIERTLTQPKGERT